MVSLTTVYLLHSFPVLGAVLVPGKANIGYNPCPAKMYSLVRETENQAIVEKFGRAEMQRMLWENQGRISRVTGKEISRMLSTGTDAKINKENWKAECSRQRKQGAKRT